ncbi:MAG: hybrid sensor histidine kinase/response regulator [Pseudomonadota bacterium]
MTWTTSEMIFKGAPNSDKDTKIDEDQIAIGIAKHLLVRSPFATVLSFLFAVLTIALLDSSAPTRYGGAWLFAVFCATVFVFAYLVIQKRYPFNPDNVRKYLLFNTFNAFASGAVWGIGMVVLSDTSSNLSVIECCIVIFCYSTAAIASHGVFPRSYFAAAGSASLIFGSYLIFAAPAPQNSFGVALLLMFLLYMVIVRAFSRMTVANLVSEQQRWLMMEELKSQRDTIERSHQDKTRFLAATSHDLAQPLHAQGHFIEALRGKLSNPAEQALLAKIESGWRSMRNLVEGLSDISKLETGSVATETRRVDLATLVDEVCDEFTQPAEAKQIRLTKKTMRVFADTDPYLFGRVLRNVLSNAIKFTNDGGHVTVRVRDENEQLLMDVIDSGVGIPYEQQGEVFEEYVQLENPERDREKGLGLGLSIVRRLCGLLEINYELHSQPESGTRFSFGLKRSEVQTPFQEIIQSDITALRMSVLVIDDERAILESMSIILSDFGCEVFCAGSIDEAVDLIRTLHLRPDSIIADLRLRNGETGLLAIAAIRALMEEDVPAIVISGNVDRLGGAELPEQSIFLAKPVEATKLYRELKNLRSGGVAEAKAAALN